MRVALLVLGVVNLALVGMVAAQNHYLAEAIQARPVVEREIRPIAAPDTGERQAAATRDVQRELAALKMELSELRSAVATVDRKAGKGTDDVRAELRTATAKAEKAAEAINHVSEKLDRPAPQTDAKQLETLTIELKRMNEQFKRVIDFAAGR